MSSVVYYKFKSQKEPSRVTFDGTGISVFDLKREILVANKLTTTAESFDLELTNPDTKEVYKDDTEVIPRSISVTVRRTPAAYPGASRYVTGVASVGKRQRHVRQLETPSAPVIQDAPAGSEEERISAMLQNQSDQWKETQQEMSQRQFVAIRPNNNTGSNANVPENPPPPSYVCYRCGQKGHWIQACPTNNDPNWEGKRVKRTTGIPKSMLQTIGRDSLKENGDEPANGNFMVNEDGDYVVAVADNKSWQNYQNKTKAAQSAKKVEDERPTDPELEDPLSNKLFVQPVKTPCCQKTYSKESLENKLIDDDFKCPNCGEEDLLLDQLKDDDEMVKRVEEYKAENEPADLKRQRESDESEHEQEDEQDSKKQKVENDDQEEEKEEGEEDDDDGKEEESNGQDSNKMPVAPMPPMPFMPPPPMMMMMPPFMPFMQQSQQQQPQPQQHQQQQQQRQTQNRRY